jgi:hypothetical protein
MERAVLTINGFYMAPGEYSVEKYLEEKVVTKDRWVATTQRGDSYHSNLYELPADAWAVTREVLEWRTERRLNEEFKQGLVRRRGNIEITPYFKIRLPLCFRKIVLECFGDFAPYSAGELAEAVAHGVELEYVQSDALMKRGAVLAFLEAAHYHQPSLPPPLPRLQPLGNYRIRYFQPNDPQSFPGYPFEEVYGEYF